MDDSGEKKYRECERFLDQHEDRLLAELQEWLRIESISTLSECRGEVRRAAEWAVGRLERIGFPEVSLIDTGGHPLVYGEWGGIEGQPTLLVYGHYDVQPVDPLEEWATPPFDPVIKDGNIYCRGASDDKSQVFLVLAALEAWIETAGAPPVNIKVLLEGEEEAGGQGIGRFVPEAKDRLRADGALICDTHMLGENQPSLVCGLRGIIYTEISMSGAAGDLHSGTYGGVAPNPVHALCILISRLKGEDGVINIPELAGREVRLDEKERRFLEDDPLGIGESLKHEMGVDELVGNAAYPPLARVGILPTLEVHGIRGGFVGEGAKTVIPAAALAKVSMRLPAGLDPDEVFGWLERAVHRFCPAGHRVKITNLHGGRGMSVAYGNRFIRAAGEALSAVYGKEPVFMREGGSIPVASLFDSVLGVPVVLMGFGLPDDGLHAPNEKFSLRQLRLGMRTVAGFLGRLSV